MRKGYNSEYLAKQLLVKEYGKINVVKVAIASWGSDYIVFKQGKIVKMVEVKESHQKKYYPSENELDQFRRMKEFSKEHSCIAEVWIKYPFKPFEKHDVKEILPD